MLFRSASLDVEKEAARWDAPVVGVGRIRLVGAGPGDPRLLTVAALEAIEEADLVIADRLVPDAILGMVRGELVLAGEKHRGSDADAAQAMIDARIVAAALAGRDVVRLHVGDPSLFGRLSETLAAVEGAGLEAEIIPGVSALSALGVPLTSRGSASRVLVASARRAGGRAEELPAFDAELTLALFMAAGSRAQVAAGLRERGWPADWPVLAVSRASQPDELRQHATVGTLAGLEVPAPAVIVVGRVGAWERPGGEALLPARRASGRPAPTAR